MDLKSIAEAYQSVQEGKVNAGLQAYLDKKKGKKENGEEKEEENGKESKGSKPDFLDLDKDGDKKEPMKKAAKEKKMKEEAVIEHHQKDADGKVIEHEDTTPSSVEEKTVLEQLAENGREIDAFEAVISYLIDEGYQRNPEKDPQNKPYREKSRAERMADPNTGINSPAFKKFMADRGM